MCVCVKIVVLFWKCLLKTIGDGDDNSSVLLSLCKLTGRRKYLL